MMPISNYKASQLSGSMSSQHKHFISAGKEVEGDVVEFSTHRLHCSYMHSENMCRVLENLLTIFLMAALECSAAVAISSKDSDGEKQQISQSRKLGNWVVYRGELSGVWEGGDLTHRNTKVIGIWVKYKMSVCIGGFLFCKNGSLKEIFLFI